MATKASPSSVIDRVRIALHHWKLENPRIQPSVQRICKLAKVNRSSLYLNHPELISEIGKKTATQRTPQDSAQQLKRLRAEMRLLKQQLKALIMVCTELRLENRSLQERLKLQGRARK